MVAETEQHYTYDAWNRMTGVYADDAQDPGNPGTRIMTYAYDGRSRLAYSHDNYYYHYYYNQQWQTLEVRKGVIGGHHTNLIRLIGGHHTRAV